MISIPSRLNSAALLGKIRALAPAGSANVNKAEAALLVVDDNEDNRIRPHPAPCARGLCKRRHGSGRPASSGAFARKPFDLVLLDIMMPNVNGYEVLAQMKAG